MNSILRIDFAAITNQVDTQLIIQDQTKQYVIELDVIDISENIFKTIFFNSDLFYVNPLANTDATLFPFISLMSRYRSVNAVAFCLLDEIIANYCKDTGFTENDFTPCSLIGLNKQITAIKSLFNVYQNRTNICSLNWNEIMDIAMCELDPVTKTANVILTFTASFIPTPLNTYTLLPTIIKFNYRTTITYP